MRKIILRSFAHLLLVVVFIAAPLSAGAQQGGTTTYVYDDNGRLHAVIAPNGEAVVYEYDAAGNVTSIQRLAADSLSILSFTPHEGLPGDQVAFTGTGFGGGVTNVSFNGASAGVVSVTPSRVVATVPATATTGLVTITTPTGSVSTATPFTVAGLRITPSFASVHFGESVQFTAEVLPATLDQNVTWSVEGIDGGNTNVGLISTSGLYTAPDTRYSSLTIRATSVADSGRFAEAQVRVNDPDDVQSLYAAAVSVQRADSESVAPSAAPVSVRYNTVAEQQAARSAAVSVRYNSVAELQAASSSPLAVQYGSFGERSFAASQGVSVQRADTFPVAGLSAPVSVQHEVSFPYVPLTAVSATMGPYIQNIAPANLSGGTTVTVTINGLGLTGATTLRFITANGAIDTALTVSNISVSGDGTSLTVDVTVSAGAALGNRRVIVATPGGDSVGVDLGLNRIIVQ